MCNGRRPPGRTPVVRDKQVTNRGATKIERDRAARPPQAIIGSARDGLYVTDGDKSILYVEQSDPRVLGHEADESDWTGRRATLHRDQPDAARVRIGGCGLRTCSPRAHQRDRRGLLLAQGLRRAQGRLDGAGRFPCCWRTCVGSVVVFRDISGQRVAAARHEVELVIRRSEALRRTLITNLPDTSEDVSPKGQGGPKAAVWPAPLRR